MTACSSAPIPFAKAPALPSIRRMLSGEASSKSSLTAFGSCFAFEPFGEPLVAVFFRRQNFQRHDAIKPGLPRFVNRAHAAAAEGFEDFELGKKLRDLGHGRRRRRRGRRVDHEGAMRPGFARGKLRVGGKILRHDAARAKSLRRVGRQRGAATRAFG